MSKSLYTNQQPGRGAETTSVHNMAKNLSANSNNDKQEETKKIPEPKPVIPEPKIDTENTLIDIVSSQLEEEDEKYDVRKKNANKIIEPVSGPDFKQNNNKKSQHERNAAIIAACLQTADEADRHEREEQKEGKSYLEHQLEKTVNKYD